MYYTVSFAFQFQQNSFVTAAEEGDLTALKTKFFVSVFAGNIWIKIQK